jgi:hypothetical protein
LRRELGNVEGFVIEADPSREDQIPGGGVSQVGRVRREDRGAEASDPGRVMRIQIDSKPTRAAVDGGLVVRTELSERLKPGPMLQQRLPSQREKGSGPTGPAHICGHAAAG